MIIRVKLLRFKRSNDGSESYQGDSISFDDNDPMSLALQEYDKIKAKFSCNYL